MKYLIIFALSLGIAQAFNIRDLQPKVKPFGPGGRVILGQPAVNGQFPHMAYLSVGCGGSLIDAKWVITAAHCVARLTPVQVYFGDVKHQNSPVVVTTRNIYLHPEYSFPDNDIALLELQTPVTFTENIKPIKIPNSKDDLYVGRLAVLSGFGYINDHQERPDVLQFVNMTVLSNEVCKEYFANNVIDSTICVNGAESSAQGICNGDSGSGLTLKGPDGDRLIGIASFITWFGCETPYPSGFVRPNFFVDWIRQTTGIDV